MFPCWNKFKFTQIGYHRPLFHRVSSLTSLFQVISGCLLAWQKFVVPCFSQDGFLEGFLVEIGVVCPLQLNLFLA
jgi:hypothetical protein